MVDKTVATECCLCYRNGALSIFLGQDRRKWLSPYSCSHFFWSWVFLTRIHYFIPILLFDPCNCLLPCLSALVLTNGPLCHLLIHPDSSWMQLIPSSFLCAGPVNFRGCEALCACSNGAFFSGEGGKETYERNNCISDYRIPNLCESWVTETWSCKRVEGEKWTGPSV